MTANGSDNPDQVSERSWIARRAPYVQRLLELQKQLTSLNEALEKKEVAEDALDDAAKSKARLEAAIKAVDGELCACDYHLATSCNCDGECACHTQGPCFPLDLEKKQDAECWCGMPSIDTVTLFCGRHRLALEKR